MSSIPARYRRFAAITPGDTSADNIPPTSAIYVGGEGNIVAVGKDGVPVTFTAPTVGEILPIEVIRISASTTATALVALYE